MKSLMIILAAGIFPGCRSQGWTVPESLRLEGFQVFRGSHCESSAMVNLLRNQGYEINENQVIGAGAALGFLFEFSDFPFLGGRSLSLRENVAATTGIRWRFGEIRDGEDGWDRIYSLLKKGCPVVLRVDMRYLPYRYGGKYGKKFMSFGWHMICLAGTDAENQTAFVTDTEFGTLQEIKLADLHRARFSHTEIFPPQGEFYWVEKAEPAWTPDWGRIAEDSLRVTKQAMTESRSGKEGLCGLDGLSRYPGVLSALDEYVPAYLLSPLLAFHYGCIETNGTGGAAFRRMYRDFLREEGERSGNSLLLGAAEQMEPVVAAWSGLAREMLMLSKDKAALKDKGRRRDALAALSGLAETLYQREKAFYDRIE